MHPAKVRRLAIASCAVLSVAIGGTAGVSGSGGATSTTLVPKVEVLEWNIPKNADMRPGAITVDLAGDGNRLWFVTRTGSHLYQLDLRGGKKVNKGQWLSWELDPGQIGNGLRKIKASKDKRWVFVDSTFALQRVDTVDCIKIDLLASACPRTTWSYATEDVTLLNPARGSDVAVDDYNNVYTAVATLDAEGLESPEGSFIQRLNPHAQSYADNVTRWYVGNNAGFCPFSNEPECLSGIATDRRNRDLVYYSEPGSFDPITFEVADAGAIAELNTRYNTVRRWSLADLTAASKSEPIFQPRQLQMDHDGRYGLSPPAVMSSASTRERVECPSTSCRLWT